MSHPEDVNYNVCRNFGLTFNIQRCSSLEVEPVNYTELHPRKSNEKNYVNML